MASRATRFALGALTCILAGTSELVMPRGDASAAEECLASPNKGSPPDKHWYYRVDRSSKRHCWYLGERGKSASRTARSTSSRRALFAKLRREEAKPNRAADARAELVKARADDTLRVDDASLTPKDQTRSIELQKAYQALADRASVPETQSLIASRWPQSAGVPSAASEQPETSVAVASAAPAADVGIGTEPIPGTSPGAMSSVDALVGSRADAPVVKRSSSLYSLFWALCGALVLVALSGGATFYMTRPPGNDGWFRGPFDVARLVLRLDRSEIISSGLWSAADGADHRSRSASRVVRT